MKIKDICLEMEGRLSNIQKRCASIISNLDECSERTGTYLIDILRHKLKYLSGWIVVTAEALYEQHGGKGHICIFLNTLEGVVIHWIESEEIVANKSRFEAWGSTVLSVKDAAGLISNMLVGLDHGDWIPVSDWLKLYGKSPGLDFGKYIQA